MNALTKKSCAACAGHAAVLGDDEVKQYLEQLDGEWRSVDRHHLTKVFKFREFMEAVDWVQTLAQLCERENHHANICIDFNRVRVDIWTHKVDGLTEADFVLAAKADQLPRTERAVRHA